MTTQIIPFALIAGTPFQFDCVLDSQPHTGLLSWNIFEQRYFLSLYDQNGTRVLTIARVGSPRGTDISLTAGYFTTALVWRDPDNQFEVIDA